MQTIISCFLLDPFDFHLALSVSQVFGDALDVSWSGMPTPHQQFVNIYRVLFTPEGVSAAGPGSNMVGVDDTRSVFKVAKLDTTNAARLERLKPNTKYVYSNSRHTFITFSLRAKIPHLK